MFAAANSVWPVARVCDAALISRMQVAVAMCPCISRFKLTDGVTQWTSGSANSSGAAHVSQLC